MVARRVAAEPELMLQDVLEGSKSFSRGVSVVWSGLPLSPLHTDDRPRTLRQSQKNYHPLPSGKFISKINYHH